VGVSRRREAIRFLFTVAIGTFGIYWGHKTPGAGPMVVVGVVIIVSAPIQLAIRLRGWTGLNAMLHQHDRPPESPTTISDGSGGGVPSRGGL